MKNILLKFILSYFLIGSCFSQSVNVGIKGSYSIPFNQLKEAVKNGTSYELSFSSNFHFNVRKKVFLGISLYNSPNQPFKSTENYYSYFEPVDYYFNNIMNFYAGTGLDYQLMKLNKLNIYLGPDVLIGKSFVTYTEVPDSITYKESIFIIGTKLKIGAELNLGKISFFTEYSQGAYYSTKYFYKSPINLDYRGFTNYSEIGLGIRF